MLNERESRVSFNVWFIRHDPSGVVSAEGKQALWECWKAAQENMVLRQNQQINQAIAEADKPVGDSFRDWKGF